MFRVLVGEHDDAISEPLSLALRNEGYSVEVLTTGPAALASALDHQWPTLGGLPVPSLDLLVLNLRLPGLDGLEVTRRLRIEGRSTPVLMLSTRGGESEAVRSLDAGADAYLAAPFHKAEVLARIRALLRLPHPVEPQLFPLFIDRSEQRAWLQDKELLLTHKEFDLLVILARERGRVVTRSRLVEELWGNVWIGSSKSLDVLVGALRRKLGDDAAHPRYLLTVRGVGFRLEVAVTS